MIISIILVGLLVIFIKHLFNRKKKNLFKPYYLDTINNISTENSVFNGSVVSSNCLKNDCASNTNYTNNNGCCMIGKSNFKRKKM